MPRDSDLRVFLCGDVMTGRGIDQILPSPCDPILHECYLRSARDYVRLAERVNGPIPARRDRGYIWGAALREWDRARPDARIVNLETSITRSPDYVPKGINYRMSPENASCLRDAGIDCCALANNHVLDWGRAGLSETMAVLESLGIAFAGAGRNRSEAARPTVLEIAGKGRIVVFSFACTSSGTPLDWVATDEASGVNLLRDGLAEAVELVSDWSHGGRRADDIVIVSIHWGSNWGYEIAAEQRILAHGLIDRAGVSAIHGHSSHHPKAIEIYRDRLVLYGCGDFLNDYEGIGGYEEFHGDLALMYFAGFDPSTGWLRDLELVPLRMRRLQLVTPTPDETELTRGVLARECRRFDVEVTSNSEGRLDVSWA